MFFSSSFHTAVNDFSKCTKNREKTMTTKEKVRRDVHKDTETFKIIIIIIIIIKKQRKQVKSIQNKKEKVAWKTINEQTKLITSKLITFLSLDCNEYTINNNNNLILTKQPMNQTNIIHHFHPRQKPGQTNKKKV